MADFRQLALDFVLEHDEPKLASLAQRAASELETAPASTNPVARWVESVDAWMPGGSGDDASRDTPDWPARAKALEFLSRTLAVLGPHVLSSSQVKLLVAFFGAMFEVDHKAGIKASATALSRIVTFARFEPSSGRDIIKNVCALNDDFARQQAKTRLAVYELLHSLIVNPAVAKHLQLHEHLPAALIRDLLQLCQSERDPDCLMLWFDMLRVLSVEYPCSQETLEQIFAAFKAYFPITLPRTSQSGITPEQLKLQLRKCFSSNSRLAALALPFLLGKLDQGDGVTVNVKLDVLRTIRSCIEDYAQPDQSVTPYVDRIWTSLKYEVRNGEVEDVIWATLEVLKAVATKLNGDELRDFTLTVTRETVGDFSSPMYTAAAGRLLISVLSANACAFALMVSPALTHIKDNLRHPKSPAHSQDLLKILHIILETRILLTESQVSERERSDFSATDSAFQSLYADVFRGPLETGCQLDASFDDISLATEAAQGAGALVCQRAVIPVSADAVAIPPTAELLLPVDIRAGICDILFSLSARAWNQQARKHGSDVLVNETIKALRRAVESCSSAFYPLLDRGVAIIRESYANTSLESVDTIQRVSSMLAFVGCSSLRSSLSDGMRCFLSLIFALVSELLKSLDEKSDPTVWSALAAGILSTVHYFKDACQGVEPQNSAFEPMLEHGQGQWLPYILDKYPIMRSLQGPGSAADYHGLEIPELKSIAELRGDFLLIGLFLARGLYRKATRPISDEPVVLGLSDDFTNGGQDAEHRYLCLISDFASFIVGEMNRCGISLQFDAFFLNLFHDDLGSLHSPASNQASQDLQPRGSWDWLSLGPLNVLSFGILRSLLPSDVLRLFGRGVAQRILIDGTSPACGDKYAPHLPVARAILAVLANKYELEKLDELMATIERHLENALQTAAEGAAPEDRRRGLDQALAIFTLAGGLLRRCTGKQTRGLLRLMLQAPNDPVVGRVLGRGLEVITAPQLYVTDGIGSVQKPLWMQKVYVDLVKPMIDVAGASTASPSSPTKANLSAAVLLMTKHMKFPIYEEDSSAILRIAIYTAQQEGAGPGAKAALEVVKQILIEAPDSAQEHLGSLVKICTGLFSSASASTSRDPAWLPQEYAADDAENRIGCGRLALEILGGIPRIFETRHVLALAPQVQRQLAAACGHESRDVRKIARRARAAWSDLK